jgi:D-3-phosphoglycerate dehydrogenase
LKLRIGLLDKVHPVLVERLAVAGHACTDLAACPNAELPGQVAQLQGLVVRSRTVGRDLLDAAAELRFVARMGSGLENIDQQCCRERGITVINSPEGNRDSVGEHCVGLLLGLLKHIPRASSQVRNGSWEREGNRGADLLGLTVGIIGYGHMGSAFAEKLKGFSVRILAHDKYRKGFGGDGVEEVDLATLLRESDVISLHLPLTEETQHYMNADRFGQLGKPVRLLNTARGPVLDTRALLDALDAGRVVGAGLDVLEYEYADLSGLDDRRDPATLKRLLGHPAVSITPHVAGVTHEAPERMARTLANKILALLEDEVH